MTTASTGKNESITLFACKQEQWWLPGTAIKTMDGGLTVTIAFWTKSAIGKSPTGCHCQSHQRRTSYGIHRNSYRDPGGAVSHCAVQLPGGG